MNYMIRNVILKLMDVNNMIVTDVLNVIMDMTFKIKNAICILITVIRITHQKNV